MTAWRVVIFSTGSGQDDVLVIEDIRARIVTDPVRWRILEILGDGKTVTELSQTLDVTDARVLYHVRRLAETGVVFLEGEATAGPEELRCLPASGRIRVRVDQGSDGRIEPGAAQMSEDAAIPPDVAGQFNQAFSEAAEGMYGPAFQTSVNHNRARLSEAQAAEFNRRLLALIEEYFPPGKGDRSGIKYGFFGVLMPIDLHPSGEGDFEE